MLPNKETNSSEESECDDLDPNTSMEVETIVLVMFFFLLLFFFFPYEYVPIPECLDERRTAGGGDVSLMDICAYYM